MTIIMRHLKNILGLLVMMMFILTTPVVAADSNYREITAQSDVQPDKANWAIHFTLPIDETSLNENNIYIIKQENQTRHPIKLELGQDKKTIYVIPQQPYDSASTYRLFIEDGIHSDTSPAYYLIKKSVMTFTTIKQPIQENITISSSQYIINNNAATITGVANNTDVNTFVANITSEAGTILRVYQADQKTLRTGNIETGDVLIVKSAKLPATKAYTITLLFTGAGAGGGAGGGTGGDNQLDSQTLADLQVVSQGLVNVISQLTTMAEKEMAQVIKDNIDSKIANPAYDHTAQINAVRARYNALSQQQRRNFQDTVLYNIPAQRLIRLADYFGF